MRILALDTVADRCDACVYDSANDIVCGEARLALGKGHAEHLIGVIDKALHEAALGYRDLDAVAVTTGPGSFTGVRVGVAAARGFALSLKIPAIGVTALEGLAADARALRPARPILVLIDARRGEVYAQCFDAGGGALDDARATAIDLLNVEHDDVGIVLAGSGAELVDPARIPAERVLTGRSSPHVETVARIAATKKPPHEAPRPVYLRKPDAKKQAGFAVARSGS